MSQVHEASFADDDPPTPLTMRYADSPRPSDEAENPQPRRTNLDPLHWVHVMRHQRQQQQLQQQQLQPPQSDPCDVERWDCGEVAATTRCQGLRENSTGLEDASQHCSVDPAGASACVEFHPVHPRATPAALSRENSAAPVYSAASSCSNFGGQSPQAPSITHRPGCAVFHAKVQRLHHGAHQAAALPWLQPTRRNRSITPPPPWVQPRLSATPHKVVARPQQQPMGQRLLVGTLVSPVPYHALPPGPPHQCAWQPNNLQAHRQQRMETWPASPATAAEIYSWQISGNAAFFGQGIPSRAAALGRRSSGQLQGQLQVHTSGDRMASLQKHITSKAELFQASPVLSSSRVTQVTEAPCDKSVRGRVAALCTPALGTRRVRNCCSPCLCDLEGSLARQVEPALE